MSTNETPLARTHKRSRRPVIDIFKSCSSALVPLMIGVMTLIMRIQQNKQANQNHLNDLQIGKDLREQELKLDEARRKQDRELANARYEQDQLLDNQRREQDYQLKQHHRQQDLQIAQTIRLDFILSTYLNEMSQLLIKYNFTLNENLRQTVARPKTLTALEQLDPKRKTLVLEFLHESNLIRGQHIFFESSRINMNGANFNNIDLTNTQLTYRIISYLSLADTQVINASFHNCDMKVSNFERAIMIGTSFNGALLSNSKFFRTSLVNTDFTDTNVVSADFIQANLTGSNITDEQLETTETYHRAILSNGTIALYQNLIQNGDAIDCDLKYWQSQINNTIEIMYMNNTNHKCVFQAKANHDNVTMSQAIDQEKLRFFINKKYFFIEVRMDIIRILSSNTSTFVYLTNVFYDKNRMMIGNGNISLFFDRKYIFFV
jgi:uncharacterized protein YjbI with pentapeptide repeats